MWPVALVWSEVALSVSSFAAAAPGACITAGNSSEICGLQSPEDLELLPDGRHIFISEMVGENNQPGKFTVLDVRSGKLTEPTMGQAAVPDWGDAACRERPAAERSPHGIHLSRLPDGRMMLLSINHGATESVQAYDLTVRAGSRVHLAWRGCVNTSYNFNDLAATHDGFIATHQFDKSTGDGPDATKFLFSGAITGYAVRWSRAAGFVKIPGTEAAFPNGVAVSADGATAWMAATAGREIRKIDLIRNVQVASAALPLAPDNLSWTTGERLLVTGADDIHLLAQCAAATPHCRVPFAVAEIDPATLGSKVIFRNDGALLLGASVAVIAGGSLYLGSFAGDHLLKAPAP